MIEFDNILQKEKEYQECRLHIHLRGAGEVVNEARIVLDQLKTKGINGTDFKTYLKEQKIKYRRNNFYISCIKYLNRK